MSDAGLALIGLAILAGIVGIVVPVLPGALLVFGAILVWALVVSSTTGWVVLAVATVLIGAAQIVKYLVPGRRMRDAGVPGSTIAAGVVVGIVGFFVIPIVGSSSASPPGSTWPSAAGWGPTTTRGSRRNTRSRPSGCRSSSKLTAALLVAGVWLAVVLS